MGKVVWTMWARLAPAFAVAWFWPMTLPCAVAQEPSASSEVITTAAMPQERTPAIIIQIEPPPLSISSAGMGMSAPLGAQSVGGKPIAAEFITENHQRFRDGSQIARSTKSIINRDSRGRVRRESQLLLPGLPAGVVVKFITIVDRNDGFGWVLDPQEMVARRYHLEGPASYVARLNAQGRGQLLPQRQASTDSGANATAKAGAESRRWRPQEFSTPPVALEEDGLQAMSSGAQEDDNEAPGAPSPHLGRPFLTLPNPVRTENLGEQMILGYRAFGTRVITTLQPGESGNERPIDIVSEQWFSPELELVMRSLHRDPWGGEFITMVTKLRRGEQAAELFTVPSQYKLIDADTEEQRHVLNGRGSSLAGGW